MLVISSIAVNRLGQFFVLFREISFKMKWSHEQGYIKIAVECKCIPAPGQTALKNGVDKSEFAHFQILRIFFSKVPKT